MSSRVAYAFRTLVGPWMLVPAFALEVANFLQRGMPWLGEGMWTVEWFAISLFIIGPLCAGAAAVDAARLSRPGNIHLVVSTPRPVLTYARAVGWCAGPLVGLHVAAIVAGVAVGQVTQPSVGWLAMLAAAAVQCLAIVWYAALGSVIGRFLSPLLAGIGGAAAGFILFYLLSNAPSSGADEFALLDMGASTVTQIGLAYNDGYLLGQAAVFIVTAALFLALGLRTRSGYRIPTAVGATAGVVAVAILVAGPQLIPGVRKVDDAQPPRWCVGTEPVVCLYHEHRRFRDPVVGNIRTLSQAAQDAGYPALTLQRVAETSRGFRPGGGPSVMALWLPADLYETGQMSIMQTAMSLLTPRHCDQLRSPIPPGEEYWWRLLSLTMTWLELADVGYDPAYFESPTGPAEILSPEQSQEIVDDFKRCDLEGLG